MKHKAWVLGVGASHNGAACLMRGDQIVVAVQEERLVGVKRAWIRPAKPSVAISYCLEAAGIVPADLDVVCCCLLSRFSSPENNVYANPTLGLRDLGTPALTISHHFGHAVSAFGTCGWNDAAVLVVDGAGSELTDLNDAEQAVVSDAIPGTAETISIYEGRGTNLKPLLKYAGTWLRPQESADSGFSLDSMQQFNSVGAMYSAAALQIFGNYHDAGKVMGLAPYGTPAIPVEEFVVIENGHLRFTCEIIKRFQHNDRYPKRVKEYRDLAASVQQALEYALMHLVEQARELSSSRNLVLAGGVALNSVVNEKIIRESGFDNVYIIPAAEDSGTAIGAAIYASWQISRRNSRIALKRDSLGRTYREEEIIALGQKLSFTCVSRPENVVEATVDLLCAGKTVGWFTGGSELGPRALGQRSILCDARIPNAKDILNLQVKFREDFRPFAPVVLAEHAHEWFDFNGQSVDSPFMLRVVPVREDKRAAVPAVVHVDGTGRLQTVTREINGSYYDVVNEFYRRTNVPILLNTSLNTRGEPIVETPEDALWCLLASGLDYCVIENHIFSKSPSYSSLLDLVPVFADGAVNITSNGNVPVRAQWNTKWGAVEIHIPTDIPAAYSRRVDILPEIDGKANGWQILERMKQRHSYPVTENSVINLLGQWRRMGALQFYGAASKAQGLAS